MAHELLDQLAAWGLVFVSLLFIIDPLGAVPIFLALTESMDDKDRKKVARKASFVSFWALVVFALAGGAIMSVFGFTMDAFRIGGGILLFRVAVDMMRAQTPKDKGSHSDYLGDKTAMEDMAIVPLGVPLLSGPVAITTVMVHASNVKHWFVDFPILIGCVASVSIISYITLANASKLLKYLGPSVLKTTLRIMGLLLVIMAVQFVLNGGAGFMKTVASDLAKAGIMFKTVK